MEMVGKNKTIPSSVTTVGNDQRMKESFRVDPDVIDAKYLLRQTATALGPIFSSMAAGMAAGHSAVLLPQLTFKNSSDYNSTSTSPPDYLNLNHLTVSGVEEESWVAASTALSMAPGCWIAGFLMEKFGRKSTFLLASPVFCFGWLTIGCTPDIFWLIIGRTLIGLCSGIIGPLGPVFVAETSEPRLRGIFLSALSLAVAVGIFLSHLFGTWLHWRLSAILCAIFPVLCLISCAFVPESPTWLTKRRKNMKARKAWLHLRGENCEDEYEALKSENAITRREIVGEKELETLAETNSLQGIAVNDFSSSSWNTWKNVLTSRVFLMPLFVLNVLFLTSQFSGINAVTFYSVTLLKDVAGDENAYSATLTLDLIRVIFSLVACWLTKNYPRKILVITSGIGSGLSMVFLSGALFFEVGKPWLMTFFLFTFTCISSIGLVPLPWILCGEIFGTSVRGLGSGISSGFGFICFFVVVKTAPIMMNLFGLPFTFSFYGIIAFIGTIFLSVFLPETKDKTLKEIEASFAKRS